MMYMVQWTFAEKIALYLEKYTLHERWVYRYLDIGLLADVTRYSKVFRYVCRGDFGLGQLLSIVGHNGHSIHNKNLIQKISALNSRIRFLV